MSVFARFPPRLQQAICSRLGWSSLRPVQELAGQALLDGRNAVVLAPTAGGKTEAAVFPMLAGMIEQPPRSVGAVYIAPIKALLNNQSDRLGLYTEMVGLRRLVWHGDTGEAQRRGFLAEPAELLMTTPESLEVMLISPRVDAPRLFSDLRLVIIDEIHALAGSDRGAHLMSVLERIARLSQHDVQRVGLSATVGNPQAILEWLAGSSSRAGTVVDPPKTAVRRALLIDYRSNLATLAQGAARVARGSKSLFFCQTRAVTEAVAEQMRRAGTTVFVHHSAVSREERELAEERFHQGADACIVCTSTLELGIDVGDLDKVLQAEAPDTVSSFLQRMGRTGRRPGQISNTTFFCESAEGVLQAIALIELAKAGWVEDVRLNRRCWPVLIHQLLAMALADGGVTEEGAWSQFSRVPDFRGIGREEFDRLIDWMLRERSLVRASGRLILGPEAERRFGRRNFMDLYAVFTSPQTYSVRTAAGQVLGSLSQDFVDRLVDEVSCFLLSGRAWLVLEVSHGDRRILVSPAPRGRQPTWGGYIPRFLGTILCQKILEVLTSDQEYRYLTEDAAVALTRQREAFADVVGPSVGGIELDDEQVRWWTFAGGVINSTLKHAILALQPEWKVVTDNLLVRASGEGLDGQSISEVLARLGTDALWNDDGFWQEVKQSLPGYRLSKFQPLMPPWIEREVLADYLLDIPGTRDWLTRSICGGALGGTMSPCP